jgi:hypothetical protein
VFSEDKVQGGGGVLGFSPPPKYRAKRGASHIIIDKTEVDGKIFQGLFLVYFLRKKIVLFKNIRKVA